MNTIQITIPATEDLQQVLIAELSELGFDAFEEKEQTLEAFIEQSQWNEAALAQCLSSYHVSYTQTVIHQQNWNALWERNFQPVVLDDFCAVRAYFHLPISSVIHDIVITPKMSFGTGHHATTYMMLSHMKSMDFANKSVADFGTGTGILAIMAEKLGATDIWAIDNDDWSIENATENIATNLCCHILLQKVQSFNPGSTFDVILANINRNVILENAARLVAAMDTSSKLLLSGLLSTDEKYIVEAFAPHNIVPAKALHKNNWLSILMTHKDDLR